MHNYLFAILICLVSNAHGQEIEMTPSEIENFKKIIKEEATNTLTITADFTQIKHMDFLTNDIETIGKLSFKSPDWVKWEYINPYEYSVVFRDEKILINDGGTKSDFNANSSKLFKKLNDLIVKSVTGDMFDDTDFNISYFKEGNYYKIVFNSRDKKLATLIESFVIHFQKETGDVNEVMMIEPSKDYTKIIFTNRIENAVLNDKVFTN